MNPRLHRALRWALACGWFGSLLWLAGCLHDVLGWRGPGDLFVAWSVPSLPMFLGTAQLCGAKRHGMLSPTVSATVVVWFSAMWWSVATHIVPSSPWQFGVAVAVVVAPALALIAWQGVVVWSWQPPAPRLVRVPAQRSARPSSVATLARAG